MFFLIYFSYSLQNKTLDDLYKIYCFQWEYSAEQIYLKGLAFNFGKKRTQNLPLLKGMEPWFEFEPIWSSGSTKATAPHATNILLFRNFGFGFGQYGLMLFQKIVALLTRIGEKQITTHWSIFIFIFTFCFSKI